MVRRRRGAREGATALETALVAPLFLTLVLGTLNVGWAVYCGSEVRHAMQRASRVLIADPSASVDAVQEAMANQLSAARPDDVDLTMTTETVGAGGSVARLTWTYRYTLEAPFVDPLVLNFDSSLIVPLRGA